MILRDVALLGIGAVGTLVIIALGVSTAVSLSTLLAVSSAMLLMVAVATASVAPQLCCAVAAGGLGTAVASALMAFAPLAPAQSPGWSILVSLSCGIGFWIGFAVEIVTGFFRRSSRVHEAITMLVSVAVVVTAMAQARRPSVDGYVSSLPRAAVVAPGDASPLSTSRPLLRMKQTQQNDVCSVELFVSGSPSPLIRQVARAPVEDPLGGWHSVPRLPCRTPAVYRDESRDRWFLVFASAGFVTPAAVVMFEGKSFASSIPTPHDLVGTIGPSPLLLGLAAIGLVAAVICFIVAKRSARTVFYTLSLAVASVSVAPLLGFEVGMLHALAG